MTLPGWVTDNASSIREEAAPYIELSPEQRAGLLAAACRAGVRLLRARADAARILEHTDPLPVSSEQALARLRSLYASAHASSQ